MDEQPAIDRPWHAMPASEAMAALAGAPGGLTAAEATSRLAAHGPNRLPAPPRRSALRRLFLQIHNLLIYVLLASAAIAALIGHGVDALVILAVVVVNAVIGFVQEGRAEAALESIRTMIDPDASVQRDGHRLTVAAETVVPGDLVLLEAGDRVPADLRLIRARNLRVEEAALTGESVPVDKDPAPVAAAAALGDRRPMVFSGTFVTGGSAVGLAVATGGTTELGRIGRLLHAVEPPRTPLIRQMDRFARQITWITLAGSGIVFAFAVLLRGYAVSEAFTTPLQPEDLFQLSRDLDKVINGAKNTVREAEAMEFPPDRATADMAVLLAEGVRHLQAAFGALGRKATASATSMPSTPADMMPPA